MKNYFFCIVLFASANALAVDNYNDTGILQMDGVVYNGIQYNNVSIQIPGYSLINVGSNSTPYPSPNTCQSGPVSSSWSKPQVSYALSTLPVEPAPPLNTITLVLFRHGEKALQANGTETAENGNMSSVGQTRAQLLPARLNHLFGCPNYTIAPNPGGLITGYNYFRPAATIEPTATTLNFPLWMPYGASNSQWLAKDLLTDPVFSPTATKQPNTAFIAWEHNNIVLMTNYITGGNIPIVIPAGYTAPLNPAIPGMIVDPSSQSMTLNGVVYACEPLPTIAWPECDYDSIWVLNIHDGNHVCYTHMYENLNNQQYQKACAN